MKNLLFGIGNVITVLAAAAIAGGELVKVGDLMGVALVDIPNGETGSVNLQGVYEVPKATGFAAAQGAKLYYDAAAKKITGTEAGNTFAGYAFAAVVNADTSVLLKLQF